MGTDKDKGGKGGGDDKTLTRDERRAKRIEELKARRLEIEADEEITFAEAKPRLADIDDVIDLLENAGEAITPKSGAKPPKKKGWI